MCSLSKFVYRLLVQLMFNISFLTVSHGFNTLLTHYITEKPNEITVTWSTMNDTKMPSIVEYGTNRKHLTSTAVGNVTEFVDGGTAQRRQYIHRVQITGLVTGKQYCKLVKSI